MTSRTPKRVLIVHDYAGSRGGAEIVVQDLRRALVERDIDARVLASDADGRNPEPRPEYVFRGSTGRMRALRETANPSLVLAARRALQRFDPDIVHLHMFLTQVSPLILPLVRRRCVIWTPHEFRPICPKGTRLLTSGKQCEERVGRACLREGCFSVGGLAPRLVQLSLLGRWRSAVDRVISPSRSFARQLLRHGISCNVVIPHPVRIPAVTRSLDRTPRIGYAGRLVPEKGVDVLIRAMARLKGAAGEAQLVILGEGPERPGLAKLAGELGLTERVRFKGRVPHDDVDRELRTAWIQVVPSIWAEPFGLVTVEAMARGTAVVASSIGAQPEIVQHERTGILVPEGDPSSLATAIQELLENRERVEQMGDLGRERAREVYAIGPITDRLLDLYSDALESSAAGS